MSNFCLYHAITNQTNSQNYPQDSTQQSSKKKGKTVLQTSKQNLSTKYPQEFNDYTIYVQKPGTQSKKMIFDLKKVSETESATSKKNKTLKSSRFQHNFDHQYFAKEQKSFRTTKSLKNSKENLNCSHLQMKIKNDQIEKHDSKITYLSSQIDALNKKIETCQAESRRNHFQFVILRDIVEKLRLQNLQLTSKMTVFDEFVKKNLKSNLELQYLTRNIQQISIMKLQNHEKLKSENNETSTLSQNQISANISIQKDADDLKAQPINLNFKKEKSSKMITQKSIKYKKVTKSIQHQQKYEKIPENTSLKSVKEETAQKKETNLSANSTIKRSKPKKILHFQNIFKQKTEVKDNMEDEEINEKIEKMLDNENYGKIQYHQSISASEQNLLESMEIIRNVSGKVTRNQEPSLSNLPKYLPNEMPQEDTSLTQRLKPEDYPKPYKMNILNRQKPQSIYKKQSNSKG